MVGWRVWALTETEDGPRLTSVVYDDVWSPRVAFDGHCHPGGCLAARWPALPHTCGIYAFKRRAAAAEFPAYWKRVRHPSAPDPLAFVAGRVSLWGKVIEHTDGFRGQRAYPYELVLTPGQDRYARVLAGTYVVDVRVDD
jgi:hypothetical protein